ncbi:MAG TPA: hypothetical protein DIT75_05255 [Rikenellaceae bacterium]|nr:hypothetical protein [Rikenellaceae bacterium]
MRSDKLLVMSLAFAALLAGCAQEAMLEPEVEKGELVPINIYNSINQVQTRATAAGFVDKDAVGLFAVNYTENNAKAGTLVSEGNQADNVKYVFDEANHKWVPVKSVYYKDVNTNVDLYLYYPYQSGVSDVNSFPFEVRKDQSSEATAASLCGYEASDFLWGKGENITPVESAVAVTLTHRLSAVEVKLAEKDGFADGEFKSLEKSVILTNTTRKATIDYSTGIATPLGGAQQDGIVMCPQSDGTFRAIVIPQKVEAGLVLFSITIDGVSYTFKQSDAVDYQVGKQLNVTINISKKTTTGTYELSIGSTQIVDWTEDRNTHGGEARQYYVVNVSEPGTLEATIKTAGKNPAKIKNLKVTGTVTTADFYFMRDKMDILEAVNMKEAIIVKGQRDNYGEDLADNVIPYRAFANKRSLYYFSFPDRITEVGTRAFNGTSLSGTLILPDDIKMIAECAFYSTPISAISLPNKLESIEVSAFQGCNYLTGTLALPHTLKKIGRLAFCGSKFTGNLVLPESLEIIEDWAFGESGIDKACAFTGDLIIPDKMTQISARVFYGCSFTGKLLLNNVSSIGELAFDSCGFGGELEIPEGCKEIGMGAFSGCGFSNVIIPSSLKMIGDGAFENNDLSLSPVVLPMGLVSVGSRAFKNCNLTSVSLPSTLNVIGNDAFKNCYNLSQVTCEAIEPPVVMSGAFDGVAKDNFTLEVPSQSVARYQSASGWQDFKRISAHYDFSVSRQRVRALNGAMERTYTLRVPSGFDWSIKEKPEWVTVTPASGTGKTDVTVTISEMARTDETFEVNEGTFLTPSYKKYTGRSGEIVFLLGGDTDYTCKMDVEQYDSDYSDGEVKKLQQSSKGKGIDIVFIGDGYDAKDIAKGTFLTNAQAGYGHFFDVEPYKTYKDYFNVYAVVSMSDESGVGTVNTIIDNKFGSYFTQNRLLAPKAEECFEWAKKANSSMDLTKSLVIMLQNTSTYEGVTMMYGDGSAIACCPVSKEAYPYDFRGLIQHEAGGHGFGKLADEYIYHNAFIQTCSCQDGCDHPSGDDDLGSSFGFYKSKGWYRNLTMNGDAKQAPWSHLIYNSKYSNRVDMYEGGYMHSRGVYRSEATSCMNNNIPYYSSISRQAIVERIKEYAGETFSLDDFYTNDVFDFGTITKSAASVDGTFGVDSKFHRATGHAPVYMGEHPNVK